MSKVKHKSNQIYIDYINSISLHFQPGALSQNSIGPKLAKIYCKCYYVCNKSITLFLI